MNYRADDERDASRVASAIITSLADASTGGLELWNDRCARVWTLLSACYAEVQSAGQYLLRKTPDTAKERFPSLVAEARAAAQPRKAATPAQPAQPVDPAQPVADPAQPAPQPAADPAAAPVATPRAAAPKRRRRTR